MQLFRKGDCSGKETTVHEGAPWPVLPDPHSAKSMMGPVIINDEWPGKGAPRPGRSKAGGRTGQDPSAYHGHRDVLFMVLEFFSGYVIK